MRQPKASPASKLAVSVLVACLLLPALAAARDLEFRVSLEDLPGVDHVEAGNIASGIAMLEARLADRSAPDYGKTLATLCGAYILAENFDKARPVCDRAVNEGPADTAHNNRGVLRIHLGDLAGARSDFGRVRPTRLEDYLDTLRLIDPVLIADENYRQLDELKRRVDTRAQSFRSARTASIESVLD